MKVEIVCKDYLGCTEARLSAGHAFTLYITIKDIALMLMSLVVGSSD